MVVKEPKKNEIPVKVESKNDVSTGEGKPMSEILKGLKPATAATRIKNAEQFGILCERHEILMEKKTSLEKFLISDDGTTNCQMIFKSNGKSFDISNNGVIKELLTLAKNKLDNLIVITDAEIMSFVI